MKLSEAFGRVCVISLPHQVERRSRLETHLVSTGLVNPGEIEWVAGIAGTSCPPPLWFEGGEGAWGCLRSHQRVLEDAMTGEIVSVCVLEDDVVFHERAPQMLAELMDSVPDDWGQLFLGGQHLHDPAAVPNLAGVVRCNGTERTHAFALHRRSYEKVYQHICDHASAVRNATWHIDHQFVVAHFNRQWPAYAPPWWMAGQRGGWSNISGNCNPTLWWQSRSFAAQVPFIYDDLGECSQDEMVKYLHFDDSPPTESFVLEDYLGTVAGEALDRWVLPGIRAGAAEFDAVQAAWPAGVLRASETDLGTLADYPFHRLWHFCGDGGVSDHSIGSAA